MSGYKYTPNFMQCWTLVFELHMPQNLRPLDRSTFSKNRKIVLSTHEKKRCKFTKLRNSIFLKMSIEKIRRTLIALYKNVVSIKNKEKNQKEKKIRYMQKFTQQLYQYMSKLQLHIVKSYFF